jgi:hypothetical protein
MSNKSRSKLFDENDYSFRWWKKYDRMQEKGTHEWINNVFAHWRQYNGIIKVPYWCTLTNAILDLRKKNIVYIWYWIPNNVDIKRDVLENNELISNVMMTIMIMLIPNIVMVIMIKW